MIVSLTIQQWYSAAYAYLPDLQRLVREVLEPLCKERKYTLVDRIKDVGSLAEKLESGRVRGWDDIDDLYGASLVVPTILDEAAALEALREKFVEVRFRARASTKTPPDVFRFDLPRFIGKLRPTREREGSPLESQLFEVQVRTAFEHAWSSATHALVYKSDHVDWKKLRLAAALRASVEQIDLALAGFEDTAARVMPGVWPESAVKRDMLRRFQELFTTGALPTEIRPRAWNRFVDNAYDLCAAEAGRRKRGRPQPDDLRAVVDEALSTFEGWAAAAGDQVPRSLSLYQTTLGVLAETETIKSKLELSVFGLDDISAIFPKVRAVWPRTE